MTRLVLAIMGNAHRLPLALLRTCGALLGALLYVLATERRRVANTNLAACFASLPEADRKRLAREAFSNFIRAFLDRSILWHASEERLRLFVTLHGEEHLIRAQGRPVILLAPHFVGLDAAWTRLTLDRSMATIYANQKDPRLNQAMLAGRSRFQHPLMLSRQNGVREALRAIRVGVPFYYLPDMDLGARDALFVPFFGVTAATVTAASRIARLTGALVLPCVATMTDRGYDVTVHPGWQDFPGTSLEQDTRRMNAFIEDAVRQHPGQYHWLHKRFKTRPPGAPPFYP